MSRNVLYYGKAEALPERTALRAGPLSLFFEDGDLRYVRLGEIEILRRVYVAVRDQNWSTIAPRSTNLRIESLADSFRITFDCRNQEGEVDYAWHGAISGDAGGQIVYEMTGEALSTFWRNRIGICLLHPASCAGVGYVVEHPDGSTERGSLPVAISPHQPAGDIQAFTHEVAPGIQAEVRFAGEVFEMEDQRNWTDASYKTYSTPLRRPYPVEVSVGTRISQSLTLSLQGQLPSVASEPAPLTFTIGNAIASHLPRIGLGLASDGQLISSWEARRLRALNLAHLRVDLELADPGYPLTLRRAVDEARLVGIGLEVALFLSGDAADELAELARRFAELSPPVAAILVFHVNEPVTSERWVALAREQLADVALGAEFGAGTNTYFTDLNRDRPNAAALDLVCYSINPQVHAFDNSSLVETVATQATTIASARAFVGATRIALTPITLKPRFNPDAVGPVSEPTPGQLPPAVDVRQMSLFGAAWTVGSLKYASEGGAASLTYYETTGWRGVMEIESGSPVAELFRSAPGGVFPLYHVLADVGELAGGFVIASASSQPLDVDGLVVTNDGHTRLILANMTAEPRRVLVEGLEPLVRIKRLDETNAEAAMRTPEQYRSEPGEETPTSGGRLDIDLRPYAIARIDVVAG